VAHGCSFSWVRVIPLSLRPLTSALSVTPVGVSGHSYGESMRRTIFPLGAVLLFVLAGCAGEPRGVDVPDGYEDLPACSGDSLTVEVLAARGEPCNLEGSNLTLPNGRGAVIGEVGATRGIGDKSDIEYTVINWGVPGVGVYEAEGAVLVQTWGSTDEAERLMLEAADTSGIRPAGE
jgi:hypothetical protein